MMTRPRGSNRRQDSTKQKFRYIYNREIISYISFKIWNIKVYTVYTEALTPEKQFETGAAITDFAGLQWILKQGKWNERAAEF